MLSVVRVDVSGDMSYCDVFVSSLNGIEDAKKSVKGLESAKGYIKKELSARLSIRKMPDFRFIPDASIERSAEIIKIIDEINKK